MQSNIAFILVWLVSCAATMLLLLRAELRATPAIRIEEKPTVDVPS